MSDRSYVLWIRWTEHVISGTYLGFLAGSVLPNLTGVILCVLILIRRSDIKTLSTGSNKTLNTLGIVVYLLTYSCVPVGVVLAVYMNNWFQFLPFLLISPALWMVISMAVEDWE